MAADGQKKYRKENDNNTSKKGALRKKDTKRKE